MNDETLDMQQEEPQLEADETPAVQEESQRLQLTGMYQNWFLDYASYVILDRSVPHLDDGLKPVQRRILHTMKRLDDGRYNKVANIVGDTMKFHPHGDTSIGDALVQMGQKELLIDTQGNWGNILTGDGAAAPRYIEARLSKLALDILFNPKTTDWKLSYDGRNKEPISLPVKFPLLLAQGAESIAVGLSAKILPHNFGELCLAAISYLKGEDFQIYPDFLTGGSIDVSNYKGGQRGGSVKVRAKISRLDQKTLVITEIPFGRTTSSIIDSIIKANEKGKIKIRKVDDKTAANVEIQIQLAPGTSSDKTIDALYAFTECEVSISPNCVVIDNKKPVFMSVSDVLKSNVEHTKDLLRRELEIRRAELLESLHFASLERIFIEERIYKDRQYEQAKDMDAVVKHVYSRLEPFIPQFYREVTRDDILRLNEIKMLRILKFNKDKADEAMARMRAEIDGIEKDLGRMTKVTERWFKMIYDKYAASYPRRTEIRSFDTIVAAKVVEANQKLYINRAEGFIGTGLKKDEFVENCSDIDDVIIFYRDGTYKVVRIADKVFVGETERSRKEKRKAEIIHMAVFKKNDSRTVYNVVYRDGRAGAFYIKRFSVTSIQHDREFDLTTGKAGSKIYYFTANPNGEAESIKIALKPVARMRKTSMERDFSEISIKSRQSRGNILTKLEVIRVTLKAHGASTLGGRKVWFDYDVKRLNFDGHGKYVGEFHSGDSLLVVLPNGEYYTTNFDPNNHYETDLLRIEKFDPQKVWTAVVRDLSQGGHVYLKRFLMEPVSLLRHYSFIGENPGNQLLLISGNRRPCIRVIYGGADAQRQPMDIVAEEFVGVKGYKAKGKRITTLAVDHVEELEPLEPDPETDGEPMDAEEELTVSAEEVPETEDTVQENVEEPVADENPAETEAQEAEVQEEPQDVQPEPEPVDVKPKPARKKSKAAKAEKPSAPEKKPRKPRAKASKKEEKAEAEKFEAPIDADNGSEAETDEPNVIDEGHSIQLDLFGNPM